MVAPAGPFVAVVIPALNEAASLGPVLAALPPATGGLPVLVVLVDDGSTDGTAEVAASAGALVARHARTLGQGDGLRTGFSVALHLGASVVVTMDADGQHDPEQLPALVEPVVDGRADYVQGSRFLGGYADAGGARHAGIVGFTWLINALAGTEITDATNGYRAVRATGLERMTLIQDRFSAAEIIIEASAAGLRMKEVPVVIRSRAVGVSRKPGGLRYPLGYLAVVVHSWARTRFRVVRRLGDTA
ncbi:MAG TPA: glycosyltransferase family 2 protein [Marmoricola sp.]|nr:glycosyltransferase family 2 protein [Marmoricola sp.]